MDTHLLANQRRMLALIQSGLAFTKDPFDTDRYQKLKHLLLTQMATNTNLDQTELTTAVDHDTGYITPKVDVRALIRHGEHFLLVQDSATKTWALPGGFADVGDSPAENVIREVHEETGLTVTVQGLLHVFDTAKRADIPQIFQYYKLVFACEPVTGHFTPNLEVTHSAYFTLANLPALSLKRTTRAQLVTLLQRHTTITTD